MNSIDYTLNDAISFLRISVGQISPEKIVDQQIIDAIHLGTCEVAQLLSEVKLNDYGTSATLTVTNDAASISSLAVQNIIKIVDSTNGLCIPKNQKQFDEIRLSPQNLANVFWVRNGNTINFYKGSLESYGTVTLWYNAVPSKVTSGSSNLTIKDTYAGIVLRKARIHLFQQLNIVPPKSWEQSVNNTITRVRKQYMDTLENKKSSATRRK